MSEILIDLSDRWRRARRAALLAVVADPGDEGEGALIARAVEANREEALRRVFDNSLRLGQGFARFIGAEVPLGDLPSMLPSLGAPCLAAEVRRSADEPAIFFERQGCGAPSAGVCGWWREAIDGLVLGATGGILHARHASGAGGGGCVGVFHVRPESALRYGPIPGEMREALEATARTAALFQRAVRVEFLGVNEGALYYRLRGSGGDTQLSVRSLVERGVRRRLPGVEVREVTERAVFAGENN